MSQASSLTLSDPVTFTGTEPKVIRAKNCVFKVLRKVFVCLKLFVSCSAIRAGPATAANDIN